MRSANLFFFTQPQKTFQDWLQAHQNEGFEEKVEQFFAEFQQIPINYGTITDTAYQDSLYWKEQHLYGSSRLGIAKPELEVTNYTPSNASTLTTNFRNYELTNHLGNVLSTIKDEKQQIDQNNDGIVDYYEPIVITANDYYPFGMVMPNRSFTIAPSEGYRFGFNTQEKESDIYGSGNAYDFGARMYDARIGRFFSKDPDEVYYPFYSPYVFAGNSVITHVDAFGLGPGDRVRYANSHIGKPYVQETDWNLRTGTSNEAQGTVDCSELVCRVLSADGIIKMSQSANTAGLITKFNSKKWQRSDYPKVGDVFLWRHGSNGHTGIVTGVDGNRITITHAKGKKYGTISEDYDISYFTGHKGWKGFYRPVTETDNSESNKFNSPQSLMSDVKRQQEAFQKQMDNFLWNLISKQFNNIKYKNNDIIKSNKNGTENSNNSESDNSNSSGSDNSNSNNTRFVSPRYVNQ